MMFYRPSRRNLINLLFCLLFLSVMSTQAQDQPESESSSADNQAVFELRLYYPNEGKLDDLLARFRNHTTALFEKHGFTNVGYWVTKPGQETSFADQLMAENSGKEALLYIVSFPNMEVRNAAWQAFVSDPEWIKVYEESRVNGALVREIHQVYMNPTDFSTLK